MKIIKYQHVIDDELKRRSGIKGLTTNPVDPELGFGRNAQIPA
jgi:hypothetical protein